MRPSAAALAERLEESAEVQGRLLGLVVRQRPAIVAGRHAEVGTLAAEMDAEARRLASAERARAEAAGALADELGLAATRWSALREALAPEELAELGPRVERLEAVVRELELANAVNGQLVRQELDLVDLSIRSLAGDGPGAPRGAYTAAGRPREAPAAGPVLLNTAA